MRAHKFRGPQMHSGIGISSPIARTIVHATFESRRCDAFSPSETRPKPQQNVLKRVEEGKLWKRNSISVPSSAHIHWNWNVHKSQYTFINWITAPSPRSHFPPSTLIPIRENYQRKRINNGPAPFHWMLRNRSAVYARCLSCPFSSCIPMLFKC